MVAVNILFLAWIQLRRGPCLIPEALRHSRMIELATICSLHKLAIRATGV